MCMYNIKEEDAKLHISKGNNKIGKGIWSFSTLPGNDKHLLYINGKGLLTDIAGTCSKYCEGCAKDGACYAWRDAKLHHNVVIRAWGENTLLLRNGKVWPLLEEFFTNKNKKAREIIATEVQTDENPWDNILKKAREAAVIKTFRINVSGEVKDGDELIRWGRFAEAHKETQFGIYTKNYDAAIAYFTFYSMTPGGAPSNLVINISEWHGVADEHIKKLTAKFPGMFNVFEYDDHNTKDCDLPPEEIARLDKLPHCPAVDKKGHHAKTADGKPITCDMCKRCYRCTGARTAVWAH